MVDKRRMTRSSRSRNASRARSASRSRATSKPRTFSKSPTRKLRTRPSSTSPSTENVKSGSSLRRTAKIHTSARSKRRPIVSYSPSEDGINSSCRPNVSSSESAQAFTDSRSFLHSFANVLSGLFLGIFCGESANLLVDFFMPLFVYWCTFLAVLPTNEKTFSRICSHQGCFIAFFGAELPMDLGFINLYVLFGVAFFNRIIMFLNHLLPIGRPFFVVAGEDRWQYKCNGISIFMLCLLAVASYGFVDAEVVGSSQLFKLHRFLPSIFLGAWVDAIVFAIHVFLNSRRIHASPAALVRHSGNFVVNFYNGCATRPIICGLDIKVLSYYASFIGSFILQLVFVIYQYHEHSTLGFGLTILLLLHCICILDFFVYEPTFLRAHDVVYYGCGLRWFQNALLVWPFLRSVGVLHLAHNYYAVYPSRGSLPYYGFPAAGAVLFILGLYIRRRAINQKFYNGSERHSFEAASILDTGATRNIVAVGWWACVRHPDYLGEMISSFGLALTAGVGSVAPWIASMCVFFNVLSRIRWDEGIGLGRYDKTAWERYTAAVPYRLVPRLY